MGTPVSPIKNRFSIKITYTNGESEILQFDNETEKDKTYQKLIERVDTGKFVMVSDCLFVNSSQIVKLEKGTLERGFGG